MCGRFSLGSTNLKAEYNLAREVPIQPHYNIAPGVEVPIIIAGGDGIECVFMRWGFQFTTHGDTIQNVINAKGETLNEKIMFKNLLQSKRCIIPATGFYEWQKRVDGKIPHYISLKNQAIFSLGGLYREEKSEHGTILSFVIITTVANEIMKPIHDRMPFILRKEDELLWLRGESIEILNHIVPYDKTKMNVRTVSRKVNYTGNDGQELIEEFRWELGTTKTLPQYKKQTPETRGNFAIMSIRV